MAFKILFIGTPFMNIYKDIIDEMVRCGFEVDFIPERVCTEDPDNVRGCDFLSYEAFGEKNKVYWTNLLNSGKFNKNYDILFVLDGQSVSPVVFDVLKTRNKNLYSVNYLFDTTSGVYRFDKNFKYFDKVATFDIGESEKYSICLLPIFWVPARSTRCEVENLFFGVGRYNSVRYKIFYPLYRLSEKEGRKSFIGFQGERIKFYFTKYLIRKIIRSKVERVPPHIYYSKLFFTTPIPVSEFRNIISKSEIIVDTNASHQDGLTARFMWALGLEKKIITTNTAVEHYAFYTKEQIYIVNDMEHFHKSAGLRDFINSRVVLSQDVRDEINKYRIENWLKELLPNKYF